MAKQQIPHFPDSFLVGEENIKLSPKVSELLHLLAINMGDVLKRELALN